MIVCSAHWERIRREACAHGLAHLLHRPHGEFEEFAAELCGRRPVQDAFDPLAEAGATAEYLALAYAGSQLQHQKPDGSTRCPICELVAYLRTDTNGIDPERYWLGTVVGIVERRAHDRGLMPRAA